MKPRTLRRVGIAIATTLALVALGVFIGHIPRTVTVFVIAAFISFGATPVVRRLERRMPRAAAIGLVYVGLLSTLVIFALVVIPVTYGQIASLVFHAPDYVAFTQDFVARADLALQARLGSRVVLPSAAVVENAVGSRISTLLSQTIYALGPILISTLNALFISVSALILSVFFVARGQLFGRSLLEFVPPRKRDEVAALFAEIASIFGHFVAGQVALCAIVGVAVWVLLLPLHFAFALLVAVICGIGYAVPFVGMIVAQVIAGALALPQGGAMVAWVTIAIFTTARIADNVLVPKIMSESVGVSPIIVMFAVFAGGELFGVPGLVLAIPAAALLKVLFKYFLQPYVARMQISEATFRELLVDAPAGTPPAGVDVDVDVQTPNDASDTTSVAVSVRT